MHGLCPHWNQEISHLESKELASSPCKKKKKISVPHSKFDYEWHESVDRYFIAKAWLFMMSNWLKVKTFKLPGACIQIEILLELIICPLFLNKGPKKKKNTEK